MKTELGIAHAQIMGGFDRSSGYFNIFLDKSEHLPCFWHRCLFYPHFSTREENETFANNVKKNLESIGIHDNDTVAVLLYEGDVIAIGSNGNDMWLDVRNEEAFDVKSFEEFNILPNSIKVYI